jgi:UDP-N-acetylglucosamine 2-epimerase (non-hydrolysing)
MDRIILVAGARPNFMKLAPLWRELRADPERFDPIIVHTGQHYDQKMSQVFFDELGLPEPDIYLGVGSGSHAQQTARIMIKFEKVLQDEEPDWVVVFGDVNSTTAASLVAAKEQFRVAHVEAGLRSGDWSMPEEINRVITDRLADLLLTPSADADANLAREGIPADRIHLVGNIMIDSLRSFLPKARQSRILERIEFEPREYALVTLHRPANVDDPRSLEELVDILTEITWRIPVVFPMHPRTRNNFERHGLTSRLAALQPRLRIIDPLGYLDFLKLEQNARVVLTDSGGLQEETTVLQIPCLTMRENTERPVTITEGSNRLVCTDIAVVIPALDQVLESSGGSYPVPRLWDGHTAKRICRVLAGQLSESTERYQQLEAMA